MSFGPAPTRAPFPADDLLPPVTPPNAKFLIRLFVIPFCIVSALVLVWLLLNWLAHQGGDPRVDIKALARDNAYRWQAAHNLADALRNPRNRKLREDASQAREIVAVLDAELAQPLSSDKDARGREVNLRMYLCRALGEFLVPGVAPVLVKAATINGKSVDEQSHNVPVHLAALEALAVLMGSADEQGRSAEWAAVPDQVQSAMLAAADYRSDAADLMQQAVQVRMRAAYGLGLVGGEEAVRRLERMLVDPSPDVRYNAAAALARNGSVAAIPLLCDMLDPDITEGVDAEAIVEARPQKRALIYETGLDAAERLAERNPGADLSQIEQALDRLIDAAETTAPARGAARKLSETLDARREFEALVVP